MTRNNQWLTTGIVLAAALLGGIRAGAADASLSVDIASAYVFRGATFNDGLVLQPGLELGGFSIPEGAGSVNVGVWANLDIDDYDGMLADGQFSEIDMYATYEFPFEAANVSVGYTEYTYPSGGGDADREVSLNASLDVPLAPSLAVFYGLDGGVESTLYIEAGIGHELKLSEALSLSLGAALGYLDPDEGEAGLSHYSLSAGAAFGVFNAAVTWVAQADDQVLPDVADGGGYDVDLYGTIGVALEF